MVERPLSMREAPGSIPGSSNLFTFIFINNGSEKFPLLNNIMVSVWDIKHSASIALDYSVHELESFEGWLHFPS